tara:strand:- start:848 stop:1243 length:396 start_codon:yes stop_codon:yes gene_type:complete
MYKKKYLKYKKKYIDLKKGFKGGGNNDLTFEMLEELDKDKIVIVLYMEGCTYCNILLESNENEKCVYDKLIEKDYDIYKIDGIKYKDLIYDKFKNDLIIKGYPTIIKIDKEKGVEEYEGERTLEELEKFFK